MTNHPQYTVVEHRHTGRRAIKLTEEPFDGIVFEFANIRMDSVEEFSDDPDIKKHKIQIKFEYEILDKGNKEFGSMGPFEDYIGLVLQDMIHRELESLDFDQKESN